MLPKGPQATPPPLWTEGHARVSQAPHYCSPLSGDECRADSTHSGVCPLAPSGWPGAPHPPPTSAPCAAGLPCQVRAACPAAVGADGRWANGPGNAQ